MAVAISTLALAVGLAAASSGPRTERAAAAEPTAPAGELRALRSGESAAPSGPTAPQVLAALSGAEVNHDVNAEGGSQAEAVVALEPDNPDRVIAAISPAPGGDPQAWISDQGMSAGSQVGRPLPASAEFEGDVQGSLSLCCQPSVTANSDGNLWLAVSATGATSHIAINRVAAGTTAFQAASVAIPRSASTDLQEQPMIAIDDDGGSAKADRLYAVWIENDAGTQDVVISECDASAGSLGDPADECDDPDNWSSPTTITDGGGSDVFTSPDIGIAPNGDVYVAWWHVGDPVPAPEDANLVEIDTCAAAADCTSGANWGVDGAVRELDAMDDDGVPGLEGLPLACPIIGAPGGRVGPQPRVEVGPTGIVYVAFSDLRDNAAPSGPTRCTAAGTDKTWDSYIVAGAAVNTAPTTAEDPVRLSDDSGLDLNDHFLPALSVDASTGDVEASLYSTKHDPSGQRTHQYHVISADDGATFSSMTQFTTSDSRFSGSLSDGIDYGSYAGADSAEGTFVPSWTDNRFFQGRKGDLYVLSPQVETTIDSAPTGTVPTATSAFGFSSVAPGFQCSTDSSSFLACTSPTSIGPLPNSPHTFSVRATDAVGNPADLSPASASWTINDTLPPQTKITKRPDNKTLKRRAKHRFEANEVGATFECRYDRRKWKTCDSPRKKKVDPGNHRFKVRATDVGGNTDPSAAKDTWTFKKKCGKKKAGEPRRRCRSENREKHF